MCIRDSFEGEATEIYTSYGLAENGVPYLSVWKQYQEEKTFLIIRYSNGSSTAFFISDKRGENVSVYYPKEIAIRDIITYFTGPVIGCILRLKNKVCLHASVVNIDNKAIAFIGEKTAGKSTLIAHLAASGYPVLSDDIAVLFPKEGAYFVHTGYPRLRLWENTVNNLEGVQTADLEPVLSFVKKYYLPLSTEKVSQWKFQQTPLPLEAVFYLMPRNEENQCAVKALGALERFLKLKQNIYADYMLEEEMQKIEFEVLGAFVNDKSVYAIDRPDDLSSLDRVSELIVTLASADKLR